MKRFSLLILFVLLGLDAFSQSQPKMIVGIVVDQMRMDYIYRYYDRFGEDGFKRLMGEGYTFHNAHFNYVPTATGPGHTSVYTGTTPAIHGVIGNNWYDKFEGETVYCAYDSTQHTIGAENNNGKMSPHRMLTTAFTDELRLARKTSKVVGISIKDRGAIFPAGHTGKAFWYDSKTGKFISSSYYYEEKLPSWLNGFNRKAKADSYMKKSWETLYPIETYTASGPDESPYEAGLLGKRTLPYDFSKQEDKQYALLPSTPFGNNILVDLAKAAIKGEELGEDDITDVLAISFSSTDYIGHNFGPNSVEVEDTYLRLDQSIAELLEHLDDKVGKGEYTVFLTADHAVANVPQRMMDMNIPAGYMRSNLPNRLNAYLTGLLGQGDWIDGYGSGQIFFNYEFLAGQKVTNQDLESIVANYLLNLRPVGAVYTRTDLTRADFNEGGLKGLMVRGFHPHRSGDIMIAMKPGWLSSINNYGTSHGSGYRYDTHVPIIFYGHSIEQGESTEERYVTDIAPTLSHLLWITMPSGSTGKILSEVIKR